jgi:hypothetical protein
VPPISAGLRYARLYADGGGVAHFADEALPWGTTLEDARGVSVRRLAAGYDRDRHPAPQRQFVVVLAGVLEIEVGDGETRRFGPGGVVLVTDLTGLGHRTPVPGPDDAASLWIPVT